MKTISTPIFASQANCDRLVDELCTWIGTPWAHMANTAGAQTAIKGVGGDCKTILATAYCNAGFIARMEFPAHGVAPGLLSEGAIDASVVKYLQRFVVTGEMARLDPRREPLLTGDVLTFRWGARDHHLGAALVTKTGRYVFQVPGAGYRFTLSPLSDCYSALRSAFRIMSPVSSLKSQVSATTEAAA